MKKRIRSFCFFVVLVGIILITAGGCLREDGNSETKNEAPIAKLSAEAKGGLVAGNPIVLDASKSSDDGNFLEFLFEVVIPGGETLTSNEADRPVYSFIPKESGVYFAKATVTDTDNMSATATLQFSVVDMKISNVNPLQGAENIPINLSELKWECNGCSDVRYKVYFIAGDSTPYLVTDTDGISEKRFPVGKLSYNGVYSWRVVADNNGCKFDTGIMKFYTAVDNSPPIVEIVSVVVDYVEGDKVTLESKVTDADDNSFTYNWEFLKVPALSELTELDFPFTKDTSFETDANGVYEVQLTVEDAHGGEGVV